MTVPRYDLVLTNGRIVDPSARTIVDAEVAFHKGRIAALGRDLATTAVTATDVAGAYVAPGFVDLHGHYFASGSPFSVPPDQVGIERGVTTVVDAGTTGWANFPSFHALEMAQARTRVLAFLHICGTGLQTLAAGVGELHDLAFADVDSLVRCVQRHPSRIIGVKVRLTAAVAADAGEVFGRARTAARATARPMMVHITDPPGPLADVYDQLDPGDVVTHAYHDRAEGILAPSGQPHPWVREARERGVLFDVGHAGTLFAADTARRAAEVGFWPDTLGTDAWRTDDVNVPDVPGLMSRFLALGMPLLDVVAAASTTGLRIVGDPLWARPWQAGAPADVTVFHVDGPPPQVRVTLVVRAGSLVGAA